MELSISKGNLNMLDKIKIILLINILFFSFLFSQSWETIGANSARTSYLDVVGPDKPEILWEGSIYSLGGSPILISNNKLVTMRVKDQSLTNAPIVCHDLYSGDTLWSLDFPGGQHSMSVPVGFKNNVVYASNWFGEFNDTLYALNADNGKILWKSNVLILGEYDLGITFTKNGDIIVPLNGFVARINPVNGDTLWCVERDVPVTSSYCGISLFNETVYGWMLGSANELQIIAIDIEEGKIKYGINAPNLSDSGYAAGQPPVINQNGIIYAHVSNDNLVALNDTGDSLSISWYIPINYGGITKPAIGPDGSVYFINHHRIMRADPLSGSVIDSSMIVWLYNDMVMDGQFAIDSRGTVYYNNNSPQGVLYSFSKDLVLNWTDTIQGLSYGGPSLGPGGILVVAGENDIVRVYKPENLYSKYQNSFYLMQHVSHIILPHHINFKYYIQKYTNVKLLFYNIRGQDIYTLNNMPNFPGFHSVNINNIHENFSAGQYIYKFNIGKESVSKVITIIK